MAVVLPQGALFRGGVEGQIRRHLLEHDLIEAVIGLAPNLFYGTGLAACVLVLRQTQADKRGPARCSSSTPPRCSAKGARRTSWSQSTARRS
jgi:type I restriction-modification system DNA methylase subunit